MYFTFTAGVYFSYSVYHFELFMFQVFSVGNCFLMNNATMMHCLATFQKSDLLPGYVCLKDSQVFWFSSLISEKAFFR